MKLLLFRTVYFSSAERFRKWVVNYGLTYDKVDHYSQFGESFYITKFVDVSPEDAELLISKAGEFPELVKFSGK